MHERKVAHVKNAVADELNIHRCHWPNCQTPVPPAMWGCRRHWFSLPKVLRQKIWVTYRIGQEQDKSPSPAYLKVANEVQRWIKEFGSTASPRRR